VGTGKENFADSCGGSDLSSIHEIVWKSDTLFHTNLQRSAGVVPRGAREAELKGRLRPSLTDKSVRQRLSKNAQNVLQENIHLLHASDGPNFGSDVFIAPQRLVPPLCD